MVIIFFDTVLFISSQCFVSNIQLEGLLMSYYRRIYQNEINEKTLNLSLKEHRSVQFLTKRGSIKIAGGLKNCLSSY